MFVCEAVDVSGGCRLASITRCAVSGDRVFLLGRLVRVSVRRSSAVSVFVSLSVRTAWHHRALLTVNDVSSRSLNIMTEADQKTSIDH